MLIGGSLRVSLKKPIDGLWIVEAESKNTVETIIVTDLFWVQELRSSVEILHWSKAFEDRQVPIWDRERQSVLGRFSPFKLRDKRPTLDIRRFC